MITVETSFSTTDRALYLHLRPEDLPRVGETVQFTGRQAGRLGDGSFTVTDVVRTYRVSDDDATDARDELSFVHVELEPAGVKR